MTDNWFTALGDWLLIHQNIHPAPCPDCGSHALENDGWICYECGRDREPRRVMPND